MLGKVKRGDFVPPRSRYPGLDPALEAICLRAMALKPEDRYATCRALADDVERWMADEPVAAWREPLSRRVRRWGWRNRTAVLALAASVPVALAGTAAVLAVQTRANGRLQQANSELEIANGRVTKANADLKSANDREKQRFSLAMDAINMFHGEVSKDLLLKEKQFEGLRAKLLKGRGATTTSATSCPRRATRPVRGPRSTRRWRSGRSWATPTPASPRSRPSWRPSSSAWDGS